MKIEQRRKVKVEKPKPVIATEVEVLPETPIDSLAAAPDTLRSLTIEPRPSPPVSRPSPPAPRPASKKYYTVKQGDSLWSIAKKYKGVTEHDLMKWNKCGPNIRPGQRLLIKGD